MTVGELITKLGEFNRDLPIVAEGYEWGYGRIADDAVHIITLKREPYTANEGPESMNAVVVERKFIEIDRESYGARWWEELL